MIRMRSAIARVSHLPRTPICATVQRRHISIVNTFEAHAAPSSAPSSPLPSAFTPRVTQSNEIRSSFLKYFERNDHTIIPSSSIVPPPGDDSMLFTTAGMVQLKEMLLGIQPPPAGSKGRLASAQKCIRAGGKHNDLENVGYTARHHTFFEMLGNFSIGAYFKEEAMVLAWQYLTKEIGLPPSHLRISIHSSDDESSRLWTKISAFREDGLDPRLIRLGDADNFWSMGDSAGTPCGPCSEIFFDQGKEVDGDRWLEIWNLVFMQYARGKSPGELIPLAKPCVDTGMGLERLTAVLQGQPTNYDSDLLRPSIDAVRQVALKRTGKSPSALQYTNGLDLSPHSTAMKVIVDHLRSASFLIAEGVVPSNVGRGYVLRRIIRRAVRFGQTLGFDQPFLTELLPPLMEKLGSQYPELLQRHDAIDGILHQEEIAFFATLHRGMKVLEEAFSKLSTTNIAAASATNKTLPGETAFLLYDSFGFPLDLTQVIARERGAIVDTTKFDELMARQKGKSKETKFTTSGSSVTTATATDASTSSFIASPSTTSSPNPIPNLPIPAEVKKWQLLGITNEFVGFNELVVKDTTVKEAFIDPQTHSVWIAMDKNPFYAAQGGQIGDIGTLTLSNGSSLPVVDCLKPYESCSVVRVHLPDPHLSPESSLLKPGSIISIASVDSVHRRQIEVHHTATHLLHAALKAVLGSPTSPIATSTVGGKKKPSLTAASINQSGSLVASDRLRFDFSCPIAISPAQVQQVEDWINHAILTVDAQEGSSVRTEVMSKADATKLNATALFGEKYGDSVRVVSIPGYSIELCGGTHVKYVRSCYPFKILSESSIASGIRRIEAVAGESAFKMVDAAQVQLKKVAAELKVQPDALVPAVAKLQQRTNELENEVRRLKVCQMLAEKSVIWRGQVRFKEHTVWITVREVSHELASSQ